MATRFAVYSVLALFVLIIFTGMAVLLATDDYNCVGSGTTAGSSTFETSHCTSQDGTPARVVFALGTLSAAISLFIGVRGSKVQPGAVEEP